MIKIQDICSNIFLKESLWEKPFHYETASNRSFMLFVLPHFYVL